MRHYHGEYWSKCAVFSFSLLVLFLVTTSEVHGALTTFNSPDPGENVATRLEWLAGVGISTPQYLVDFESGFSDDQDISTGWTDAGGLTISSTYSGTSVGAKIVSGNGSIQNSNPVGTFALASQNNGLVFTFSVPVNYIAFQDIDQQDTVITFYFSDGSSITSDSLDTTATSGDSAEFVGFFVDGTLITKMEFVAGGISPWGIDNIEYGRNPALIPVPNTLLLLGPALFGVFGILKRKINILLDV